VRRHTHTHTHTPRDREREKETERETEREEETDRERMNPSREIWQMRSMVGDSFFSSYEFLFGFVIVTIII
jgi:hypothetical protein